MKTIAVFNNKGGVGKTNLVYHLAHMLPRIGYPTVAIDLDPQANLTCAFFDEQRIEEFRRVKGKTIFSSIQPTLAGTGDIESPVPFEVSPNLWVVAGDLDLSVFEDMLSESWPRGCLKDLAALRTTSAFYRIVQQAGRSLGASVALLDLGPNLGAINRAALLAADYLVIPLMADLFALQALENLGPTVRAWCSAWQGVRRLVDEVKSFELPEGQMQPAGYVVLLHAFRLDRATRAYARGLKRIPSVYREAVLGEEPAEVAPERDHHCLAMLRNYHSLILMAQEARKPMFDLRPADGAIGSHAQLVQTCNDEFEALATTIARRCDLKKAS